MRGRYPIAVVVPPRAGRRGRRERPSGEARGALPSSGRRPSADRARTPEPSRGGAEPARAAGVAPGRESATSAPPSPVLGGECRGGRGGSGALVACRSRRRRRRRPSRRCSRRSGGRPPRASRLSVSSGRSSKATSSAKGRDGVVLIDQHAAHERVMFERLRAAETRDGVARDPLLVPEAVAVSRTRGCRAGRARRRPRRPRARGRAVRRGHVPPAHGAALAPRSRSGGASFARSPPTSPTAGPSAQRSRRAITSWRRSPATAPCGSVRPWTRRRCGRCSPRWTRST